MRKVIRKDVRNLKEDRRMDLDIAAVVELMKERKIIETVEKIVGNLL